MQRRLSSPITSKDDEDTRSHSPSLHREAANGNFEFVCVKEERAASSSASSSPIPPASDHLSDQRKNDKPTVSAGKKKVFPCNQENCHKIFYHKQNLSRHIHTVHSKTAVVDVFKCEYPGCQKIIRRKQNMKKHMERAHIHKKINYICITCNQGFSYKRQLISHTKSCKQINPLRCTQCNIPFKNQLYLKRHLSIHSRTPCKYEGCSFTGHLQRVMIKHYEIAHPTDLYCHFCNFTTVRRSALRQHIQTHFSTSSFPCPVDGCDRSYRFKKNLKTHLQINHGGKRFPCSYCPAALVSKQKLVAHERLHEGGRPVPAPRTRPVKKGVERRARKDMGSAKGDWAGRLAALGALGAPDTQGTEEQPSTSVQQGPPEPSQ